MKLFFDFFKKNCVFFSQNDEKCDFLTTPGWLSGGNSRQESGLPKGCGPYKIITNMAVMDFEPESKRMRIISVNPGYSVEEIQKNESGKEVLHIPSLKEAEEYLENINRVFENEKYYLISRWNASRKRLGSKLFG